jgi:hypothetical protein
MKVFANNVTDWVVAKDIEDAKAAYREHWNNVVGPSEDEMDLDFEQVPDDRVLTRDECRGEPVRKTAAEWAASEPRGFLMSTEY